MLQNDLPPFYATLNARSDARGFTMPSDASVGRFLRTLTAAKPGGRFLELGTGMGLSLAWMIDGMDAAATVISLDNDRELIEEVSTVIGDDRVELLATDGEVWLKTHAGPPFDLIFADTWPGKYRLLEEAIDRLAPGGLYVADDMLPQDNWPAGHAEKAKSLTETLRDHPRLRTTVLDWGTGVILAARVA